MHPEVIDFLAKHYPLRGCKYCSKRLGLSVHQVYRLASMHGIRYGEIDGYVKCSEVARSAGVVVDCVVAYAKARKVLKYATNHKKYADAFIREDAAIDYITQRQEKQANETAGFISTAEAAAILGIPVKRLRIAISQGKPEHWHEFLKDIRKVVGGYCGTRWLLDPWDVEEARRKLDERKRLMRSLVTIKALSVEVGLNPDALARRLKARKVPLYKFIRGGRFMLHVTREVADSLRSEMAVKRLKGAA